MKVPINIPILGREEIREVNRVLKSGVLTDATIDGGPNVREFERLAGDFLKSRYAVAVSSGTAAIQAALYALNIGPGDEVLLPSFTFVATANAVVSTGAKPVFVDILEDYTIDPADLCKKITGRSRAIIPVHLYGHVAQIEEIARIAKRYQLKIVEDAAQSMGSTYKGRQSGTFGDAGCFSLYPAKVMMSGEGGLVATNSKRVRDRLLMTRNHGMIRGYDSKIFGLNLRMPEINAAIAKIQIKRLPSFIKKRTSNAEILSELLSDADLILPRQRAHEKTNWYIYTISTARQRLLKRRLNSKGFGASIYYPVPVHKIPFYNIQKRLPVTERAARRVLSLPVHPGVTRAHLGAMARIISGRG